MIFRPLCLPKISSDVMQVMSVMLRRIAVGSLRGEAPLDAQKK
jgi:hypothetical protein